MGDIAIRMSMHFDARDARQDQRHDQAHDYKQPCGLSQPVAKTATEVGDGHRDSMPELAGILNQPSLEGRATPIPPNRDWRTFATHVQAMRKVGQPSSFPSDPSIPPSSD